MKASACRALVPTIPAAYAVVSPMRAEIGPEDLRWATDGATLWSLAPMGRYAAQVNGQWIGRAHWNYALRPGDLLVFVHVAHGGGGSSPLRFVLQLAVLAAAFYAPGALGFAAGSLGAALTTAGVAIAGNFLVNRLAPLPGATATQQSASPSPTYSIVLAGNQLREGQSIPVRYGQEFVFPDFIAEPYSEYDANDDQFFCAAFCWGMGSAEITQITIDDTPLENFDGVTCVRVGPGQSTRIGPFSGVETFDEAVDIADTAITSSIEVGGQELTTTDWVGPFTVNGPGTAIERVYVDLVLPRGLGVIDQNGATYARAYDVDVQLRTVNNAGLATGSWATVGTINLTGAQTSAIRRSYSFATPAEARYQIRIRRNAIPNDPPLAGNVAELGEIVWTGARGRTAGAATFVRDDASGIVLRMRANAQLSGLSQRRIGMMAKRLLPVWDGSTWSAPQATRNPAWAFCDVLKDATYGRGLTDSRIDLGGVLALAQLWDERQDRFDFSFDSTLTVDDALRVIARAGRAVPVFRRGSVYTMVRDGKQAGPVAAFMPRSMENDSFTIDFTLPTEETPDAVRLTYRSNVTWQQEVVVGQLVAGEVIAYDQYERPEGIDEPINPVEVTIPGIAGKNHALREAAYIMADSAYRRTRCSWTTELEGMVPSFGSLVALAHDVAQWAQSGDVLSWNAGTRVLVPADALTWTEGEQHYVRIQTRTGGLSEPIGVSRTDDGAMLLDSAYAGTIVTDDDAMERTRYLFGARSDVMRYARITAMAPQAEKQIRLEGVIEDDRVHDADVAYLSADGTEQDPPPAGGTLDEDQFIDETGLLVNYLGYSYNVFTVHPTMPAITVAFGNDGSHTVTRPVVGAETIADQWLKPQPVGSAVAGRYEIQFDFSFARETASAGTGLVDVGMIADYVTSPTLGAWNALSTARSVVIEMPSDRPAGTIAELHMIVRIRDVATGTVLAERTPYFYLQAE